MSKVQIKRISEAYGRIYDKGDNGLEYMDRHGAIVRGLMPYLYNNTLDTLSRRQLTALADSLETIADDADFDLEDCDETF
jgi:hypothetical protein